MQLLKVLPDPLHSLTPSFFYNTFVVILPILYICCALHPYLVTYNMGSVISYIGPTEGTGSSL